MNANGGWVRVDTTDIFGRQIVGRFVPVDTVFGRDVSDRGIRMGDGYAIVPAGTPDGTPVDSLPPAPAGAVDPTDNPANPAENYMEVIQMSDRINPANPSDPTPADAAPSDLPPAVESLPTGNPATADPATPAATPATVPTADRIESLTALFIAAVTPADPDPDGNVPDPDLTVPRTVFLTLPPATRGRAVAACLTAGIRAGLDGDRVADAADAMSAPATAAGPAPVNPAHLFAGRAVALDAALTALSLPDGLTADTADAIRAAVRSGDLSKLTADGGILAGFAADDAAVRASADRAVAAVSRSGGRGGSTGPRGPVQVRRSGSAPSGGAARSHLDTVAGLFGQTVTGRDGQPVQVPANGVTMAVAAKIPSAAYPAGGTAPSPGALANAARNPRTGAVQNGAGWVGVVTPGPRGDTVTIDPAAVPAPAESATV